MAKQTVQEQIKSALIKQGFKHLPTVTGHAHMVKHHVAGDIYVESVYIQANHIKCKVSRGTQAYKIIVDLLKRKHDFKHECGKYSAYVSWDI